MLANLKFVVTGEFMDISRPDLTKFIEEKGGTMVSGVSGVTSYLIAGHKLEDGREVNTSGKYKKAIEKKVRILTEEGFEKLI